MTTRLEVTIKARGVADPIVHLPGFHKDLTLKEGVAALAIVLLKCHKDFPDGATEITFRLTEVKGTEDTLQ